MRYFGYRQSSSASVQDMASQEIPRTDDSDRILIQPSTCSTFVVKKSSVGHVPYEPSKGAVGRDVAASRSTAAHGGHRITTRTDEIRQQQSQPARHGDDCVSCPLVVPKDVEQSSVSAVTVSTVDKPTVDEDNTNSTHLSRVILASFPPSDVMEDSLGIGLFHEPSPTHSDPGNFINSFSSDDVQMLKSEVVSLKEQLVVQSKVCL